MNLERSSGILLHITSLPGTHGLGTLGAEALAFADTLKTAGQRYWQILPIGPVGKAFDYSPYASSSTFAGNWLFISLEKLSQKKWFAGDPGDAFPEGNFADFDRVIAHKRPILDKACDDFFSKAGGDEKQEYERFCKSESSWLDDFALYSSLTQRSE